MSEATATSATSAAGVGAARGLGRRTFWGLVRSEWIKLWAQPATWVQLGLVAVLTAGFNLLVVKAITSSDAGAAVTPDMVASLLIVGWDVGILVLGIAAIRSATTEYSSHSRASYLVAAPRRWTIVAAKALVLAVVFAVLSVLVNLLDHVLIAAVAGGQYAPSFSSASYLGLFWGSAATVALIALFGVGLGEIVRSTAGGITAWIVIFYLASLPLSLASSRWQWASWVSDHWISSIIDTTTVPIHSLTDEASALTGSTSSLPAWEAFASLGVWAVVAAGFGLWRALRSDV